MWKFIITSTLIEIMKGHPFRTVSHTCYNKSHEYCQADRRSPGREATGERGALIIINQNTFAEGIDHSCGWPRCPVADISLL
jgi:hypothetical protein